MYKNNLSYFQDLLENLKIAGHLKKRNEIKESINYVFELFPALSKLKTRKAGFMSGGEQQMLAIARAVTAGSDLMMLDEPSEGLAPVIREELKETISELAKEIPILLVEQNLQLTLDLSDRIYIIVNGGVAFVGTPQEMEESKAVEKYLMV